MASGVELGIRRSIENEGVFFLPWFFDFFGFGFQGFMVWPCGSFLFIVGFVRFVVLPSGIQPIPCWGSDCGHLFVWDAATAQLLLVRRGGDLGNGHWLRLLSSWNLVKSGTIREDPLLVCTSFPETSGIYNKRNVNRIDSRTRCIESFQQKQKVYKNKVESWNRLKSIEIIFLFASAAAFSSKTDACAGVVFQRISLRWLRWG